MSGTVAIFGAGAGGTAAAVDLGLRGWGVRLWNRSAAPLDAVSEGIEYDGVLGEGRIAVEALSTDADEVLAGADVAVVCLPALAHGGVAEALGRAGVTVPIVLNPGHTGGALHFRAAFAAGGWPLPPLAELSTLTYVARKYRPERVTIGDTARSVRVAALPGGGPALDAAATLFPCAQPAVDVVATDLSNVNLVLHPPGAITGAAWIEATGGDYHFYVEGMTPGVVRVIRALDSERRAVARAFGHDLPPLEVEMAAIGTADADAARHGETGAAIRLGVANAALKAPDGLGHRYYREDLGYGIVPFLALAGIAGVRCPTAEALLHLGETLLGEDVRSAGLGAERLGLGGMRLDDVTDLVRGRTVV